MVVERKVLSLEEMKMQTLKLMYWTNDLRSFCKLLGCYAIVLLSINLFIDDGPLIGVLLAAVIAHFVWSGLKVMCQRVLTY